MFSASVAKIREDIGQLAEEARRLGKELNKVRSPRKNKGGGNKKSNRGIKHEDPLINAVCRFAKRQEQAPEARVNLIRDGVLALGLLPPKRWLRIKGNVKFRRNPSHLAIGYRYRKWKESFTAKHRREPTAEEASIIIRDLAPMIEDLARLGSSTETGSANSNGARSAAPTPP